MTSSGIGLLQRQTKRYGRSWRPCDTRLPLSALLAERTQQKDKLIQVLAAAGGIAKLSFCATTLAKLIQIEKARHLWVRHSRG